MRVSDRIVLEFKPGSGINEHPKIALEDGDRFVVSPFPTVNVVGAVNDQNSILNANGRDVGT